MLVVYAQYRKPSSDMQFASRLMQVPAPALTLDHHQLLTLLSQVDPVFAQVFPEIMWLHQPDDTLKIDHVRQLQSKLAYSATKNTQRVIFFNLDGASLPAQNALLKVLEEPPAYTLLTGLTSNAMAVLPTIQSRCIFGLLMQTELDNTDVATTDLSQLESSSIPELLELASACGDRSQAAASIAQVLRNWSVGTAQISAYTASQLLQAYLDLQANTNVALCLEEYFLRIYRKSSSSNP